MTTIRNFFNPGDAGFAQSLLESAGIHAVLADEHTFTMGPGYAPTGIRLQVPEGEVARAREILEHRAEFAPLPDDFVPPEGTAGELSGAIAPTPEGGAFGAFVKGGLWMIAAMGTLALLAASSGGTVRCNWGGILMLFLVGGVIGIGARAIYQRGVRDAHPR